MPRVPVHPESQSVRKVPKGGSTRREKILKESNRGNSHERFMKKNLRYIILSGGISLFITVAGTLSFIYFAPVLINYAQDNVLSLMGYLRGRGDPSLITAKEVEEGILEKRMEVSDNITSREFYSMFYQQDLGLFRGNLFRGAALRDVMKVVSKGSRKKVSVCDDRDRISDKSRKGAADGAGLLEKSMSLRAFNKLRLAHYDHSSSSGGEDGSYNVYMLESETVLPKALSDNNGDSGGGGGGGDDDDDDDAFLHMHFDGAITYASVHVDRGPPFRQGRHRLCECMQGELDFAFFHPNALPTVGFSASEGLRAWMREVAPTVSPLFAPIHATLVPGQVLYIPEGYYYSYSARAASDVSSHNNGTKAAPTTAALLTRESAREDVGTEYYSLIEGGRRMALRDYTGAVKLYQMGLEMEADKVRGHGRRSFLLLYALGEAQMALKESEAAEVAYRDAISQNSRHEASYLGYMKAVMATYSNRLRSERALQSRRINGPEGLLAPAAGEGECNQAFGELRNEAKFKVRSAAALAMSSNVLTPLLASRNATFCALVQLHREEACEEYDNLGKEL